MYLYNIHTHQLGAKEIDGYKIRYILNVSPDEFVNLPPQGDNVHFSCGVHPWYSDIEADQLDLLESIASSPLIVAVGEAGIDKVKGPDLAIQVDVFRRQIELAISLGKPIIIHCVKAWDELISLYKEYNTASIPWIIHGYRGNAEQTKQLSKIGFKFSIGEYFNTESLKHIPTDSIYCETDTSNNSICKVYSQVSSSIGFDFDHFAILVEQNMRFYSL